jgi:hypothetical protein
MGVVEVLLHAFMICALKGGYWSASREGSGKHWVRERLMSECIVTGDVGADVRVCVVAVVLVT